MTLHPAVVAEIAARGSLALYDLRDYPPRHLAGFQNYFLPVEDGTSAGVDPLRFKQMQDGATVVIKVCCCRP